MATLTLREVKGSPLTYAEMDGNLTNLNTAKQEVIPNLTQESSVDIATDKISFYDASTATTRSILLNAVQQFVERTLIVKCVADGIGPAVGDGITHVVIPSSLNGKNLSSPNAHVYTVGTGGSITNVQIHNITTGYNMLSTPITIDLNEKDSSTAATPPVIGGQNDVSTGDVIRIDVDAVATNTLGLEVRMVFST